MKTATRKFKLLFFFFIGLGVLLSSSFTSNQALAQTKKSTAAKTSTKSPKFSDYVLTADQLFKMPINDQVAYIQFLQNFVAQLETMQDARDYAEQKSGKRKKNKSSAQFLFEQFLNRAEAQNQSYRTVGNYCLYAGSPSQYEKASGGYLRCQPRGVGSCPRISGREAVECNSMLFNRAMPGKSAEKLCVDRVPQNYNPSTGTPGITERCVRAFEQKLGGTVQDVIKARLQAANANPAEKAEWKKFFEDLKKSFDDFSMIETAGGGKADFWKYCGKDFENALNSNKGVGRQVEECKALGRLIGKFEDVVEEVPDIPRGPAEIEQRTKCPGIVVCRRPPIDHYATCMEEMKDRPAFACAICSVRTSAGGGDYENWISFLALGAQMYGDHQDTSKGVVNQKALLSRVADMVDAYGVCSNDEFPLSQNLMQNPKIRDFVEGRSVPNTSKLFGTTSDERAIIEHFGLKDLRGMTFLKQLFNDPSFNKASLIERRLRFQQALKSNGYGPETSDLYPKANIAPMATCANKLVATIDYSPLTLACKKTSDWDHFKHQRGVERDVSKDGVQVEKPDPYKPARLALTPKMVQNAKELKVGSLIRKSCGLDSKSSNQSRLCPTSTVDMGGGGGDGGSAGSASPAGAGEGPGSGPGASGPGTK